MDQQHDVGTGARSPEHRSFYLPWRRSGKQEGFDPLPHRVVRQRGRSRPGRGAAAVAAVLAATGSSLLVTGTSGATGASPATSAPSGTVNLVAYSTPEPAYAHLIADFNATAQGKNVTVTQSFGASGTQAKAVIAGQPADVVNFSTASDMEKLVTAKLVSPSWSSDPVTHGMVTDSVVAFVVPKGNPEHVTTWGDLLKNGVRIFTPNPFSSGSARWNLLAAYGAELKLGDSATQARAFLTTILQRTVVQDSSAADELTAFEQDGNPHDVLLDYEDDAIQAIRAGAQLSYVVPKQDILIENPIAVTTDSKDPAAAEAFLSYLLSPAGQTVWAKLGYRPVLPSVEAKFKSKFPHPAQLFKIEYLGGWDAVNNTFFGTSTSSPGIVTQIESSLGQTTA
ncbi:MAG TPA: sulfate ABC transporter substrate-binding protein [Acidimicrobiales bacterium]|nr:sulfate ABC transporter substrate-binding protein [Acidimicrobiales bacterium]